MSQRNMSNASSKFQPHIWPDQLKKISTRSLEVYLQVISLVKGTQWQKNAAFQQAGTCGQEGNVTPLKMTASEAIQMLNEINLAPAKLLIPFHVPFQPKLNLFLLFKNFLFVITIQLNLIKI